MRYVEPFFLLIFTVVSVAAASNDTARNFFITTFSDGRHPDDIEASRNSTDSRSADDDLEGNWGTASEGFQLSIRFEKQVFVVGEPIAATILLRNVSVEDLHYHDLLGLGRDFKLLVVNQQRKALADLADHSRGKSRWHTLFKGTQHKVQVRLDSRFDMSAAGEYVVSVARRVPEQASRVITEQLMTNVVVSPEGRTRQEIIKLRVPVYSDGYREVVSGNAVIRIMDPAGAAAAGFTLPKQHAPIRHLKENEKGPEAEIERPLVFPATLKHDWDPSKGPRPSVDQSKGSDSTVGGPGARFWNTRNVVYSSLVLVILLTSLAYFVWSLSRSHFGRLTRK
jgi:hypothetical protein